jgi:hypothetical protein
MVPAAPTAEATSDPGGRQIAIEPLGALAVETMPAVRVAADEGASKDPGPAITLHPPQISVDPAEATPTVEASPAAQGSDLPPPKSRRLPRR